jgi:hypothetical protein
VRDGVTRRRCEGEEGARRSGGSASELAGVVGRVRRLRGLGLTALAIYISHISLAAASAPLPALPVPAPARAACGHCIWCVLDAITPWCNNMLIVVETAVTAGVISPRLALIRQIATTHFPFAGSTAQRTQTGQAVRNAFINHTDSTNTPTSMRLLLMVLC